VQTGNERKASSWDGTELDVSDPDRYQKEETYVPLFRVTVRSLRAAFPFLIIGWACQHGYLSSHIPLKSIQWVGFKVWNSGRSWIRPPVAAPVYKLRSTLIWWLLWFEVLGSFIRWKEVELKRHKWFQYYIKKQDQNMLGTGLRMPKATGSFFSLQFDLKQIHNTIVRTPVYLSVHMSVHWRSRQAHAALDCVTSSHLVSSHCSASWSAESSASPPDYCS